MENWISGAKAADLLGVTPATIRAWVRSGRLKGYVAGRVTRVRPESIKVLLAAERSNTSLTRNSDGKRQAADAVPPRHR